MPAIQNETGYVVAPVETPAQYGSNSASYVVKGTFDIIPGAAAVPSKNQVPVAADTTFMDPLGRSLAWPDDLVPFKPHTDFFIVGAFHQPGGIAAPQGHCAFRCGPLAKELRVRGPRVATRVAAQGREPPGPWAVSDPTPVSVVPLRWELSLGGLRDKRNQFGLGRDPEVKDGVETLRLPLIESVTAPEEPANFAPVPAMFEQRRRKLGTRDQRWQLFRAPMPPEDFDRSHVNAAPLDQQAGDSPRGDEPITLVNLHPTLPELSFRLPGLRMRIAVLRRRPEGVVAEEIAMKLDTIGVLPEENRLVLLWRGVVPLQPHRALDDEILACEVCAEPLDAPPASPDLPERLLARWQAQDAAEKAQEQAMEAQARDEMKKLLPKANLPPEIAALVENDADPKMIFDAIIKHVEETAAAIQARLPKV